MNSVVYTDTHCQLVSSVRYGYWFNLACETLYSRADFALNFIQLLGGSGAVYASFQKSPDLAALFGLVLAACAFISLLVQPGVKGERHRAAKCEYLALEGRAWAMKTSELEAALSEVRRASPPGMASLAVPAFNNTMRAIGQEQAVRTETFLQRLMSFLA